MDPKAERKARSAVQTATMQTSGAVRDIEKIETHSTMVLTERAEASIRNKLDRAEAALDDVPDGFDGADEVRQAIDDARRRIAALSQGAADDAAAKADTASFLDQRRASGALEEDVKTIEFAARQASALWIIDPEGANLKQLTAAAEGVERACSFMTGWPRLRDGADAALEQYPDVAALRRMPGNGVLIIALEAYPAARSAVENAVQEFPDRAAATVAQLEAQGVSAAEDALSKRDFWPFLAFDGPVQSALTRAQSIAAVAEAVGAGHVSDAAARMRGRIDALAAAVREEVIAANEPWDDIYAGADRAEMEAAARAAFLQHFPGEDIMKVSMPYEWKRTEGWSWDRLADKLVFEDKSRTSVWVVVRTNDRIATQWLVDLTRNHREGDRLSAIAATQVEREPSPNQQVLLSKL
ncbi:MAG: hypothetical protein NXI12_14375 [Alphaproteobacteria bacterium]|nr:hypothetical protein [Alphaproteobacteria bacterium]